jgi:hypothetical protein
LQAQTPYYPMVVQIWWRIYKHETWNCMMILELLVNKFLTDSSTVTDYQAPEVWWNPQSCLTTAICTHRIWWSPTKNIPQKYTIHIYIYLHMIKIHNLKRKKNWRVDWRENNVSDHDRRCSWKLTKSSMDLRCFTDSWGYSSPQEKRESDQWMNCFPDTCHCHKLMMTLGKLCKDDQQEKMHTILQVKLQHAGTV